MRLALLLLTIQLYSLPGSCQIVWLSTAMNGLNVSARVNHYDPNRSNLLIDRKSTRLTLDKSRIMIGESVWEITQRAKRKYVYSRYWISIKSFRERILALFPATRRFWRLWNWYWGEWQSYKCYDYFDFSCSQGNPKALVSKMNNKQLELFIYNPNAYDASVKVLVEDAMLAASPLGQNAFVNWTTIKVAAGKKIKLKCKK